MKSQIKFYIIALITLVVIGVLLGPRMYLLYRARGISLNFGERVNINPSSRQIICREMPSFSFVNFENHNFPLVWGEVSKQKFEGHIGELEFKTGQRIILISLPGVQFVEALFEQLSSEGKKWALLAYGKNNQVSDRMFYEQALNTTYEQIGIFTPWNELIQKIVLLTTKSILISDPQIQSLTFIEDGQMFVVEEKSKSIQGDKIVLTIFKDDVPVVSAILNGNISDSDIDCFLKGITFVKPVLN